MDALPRRVKARSVTIFLSSRGAKMRYHLGMECEACGGRMNSASVVCPHCGARRANAAAPKLDGDEIRALLVASGVAPDEEERDWLATLVLPHPSTHGGARVLELVLTAASLPFVLVGVIAFAFHRLRKKPMRMRGELGPLLLMSIFGALGMWTVLGIVGASGTTILEVILGSIGVLAARAVVRSSKASGRGRDLMHIDKPAKQQLAAPPPSPVVTPPAAAPDAPADGEEPRLLR